MPIWLVEDNRVHAKEALAAICRELGQPAPAILVNRDIEWPEDKSLPTLNPDPGPRRPSSLDNLPDLVILDLLNDSGTRSDNSKLTNHDNIPGQVFYERLRVEEQGAHKANPAYVIVWSQFHGLRRMEDFVNSAKERHAHRFSTVEQKVPELLADRVKQCLQMIVDRE